jgi:surface polysaccharide O-acyltransferase-like enzyme
MGVISIHAYNLSVYGLENAGSFVTYFEKYFNKLAGGICVPFFFVIAGFLFFRNFDMSLLRNKYKSRCKSVLIPYLVWNTLYFLLFEILLQQPLLKKFINYERVTEGSFAGYIKYLWDGYYTFWFLRVLMALVLIAPILQIVLKSGKYHIPEILLIILVVLQCFNIISGVGILNIYYFLGAYIGINHRDLLDYSSGRLQAASLVTAIVCLLLVPYFAGNSLYNLIFIVSCWYAINLVHTEREVPWWMKCTFFFYCGHDIILETIEKIILIAFGKSTLMAFVDYIFSPILTMLVLIAAAYILRRYIKPVWMVLNGGR